MNPTTAFLIGLITILLVAALTGCANTCPATFDPPATIMEPRAEPELKTRDPAIYCPASDPTKPCVLNHDLVTYASECGAELRLCNTHKSILQDYASDIRTTDESAKHE